jgi:hypothetical protein
LKDQSLPATASSRHQWARVYRGLEVSLKTAADLGDSVVKQPKKNLERRESHLTCLRNCLGITSVPPDLAKSAGLDYR